MTKIKPFLAMYVAVAVATTVWVGVQVGVVMAVAAAFLWLVVHFALKALPTLVWPQYVALFGLAFFLTTGAWYFGQKQQNNLWDQWFTQNTPTQNAAINEYNAPPEKDVVEENAIFVEAETGTLKNEGVYSYIGESARGGEAYLGDKNAQAMYKVAIAEPGAYTVWIKINDDGLHDDGARNATLDVNNTSELKYAHVSKVRDGWEWEELGTVTLVKGDNELVFVKDEDTSAAFVMDAFKLVPTD